MPSIDFQGVGQGGKGEIGEGVDGRLQAGPMPAIGFQGVGQGGKGGIDVQAGPMPLIEFQEVGQGSKGPCVGVGAGVMGFGTFGAA